ncbi:MAG: winged helix-turn-helix domain-containing protein [Candidatus Pacearchaeota archaeon]|jgi:predicted transcriptional regulator
MDDKLILDILNRTNNGGLTITEIVNESGLSRGAVRIILARLEGGEKVIVRKVGMAKLYQPVDLPMKNI